MVEIKLFHYRQKNNFLNKIHPLTKIGATLLFSTLIAKGSLLSLLFLLILFGTVSIIIFLPLKNFKKELRFFLIMGLSMAVIRYVSTTSLNSALTTILRFTTIVFLGMLFADTTAPDDISKAIGNFLGPLFGNAGYRVGWILELTLSTIYLLFDVTAQVSMARKARGESAWKNPIKRVVSFSTTIFDLLLLKAMQLEEALVARNFNIENRQAKIKFTYRDILFILAVTLFSLALFKFT